MGGVELGLADSQVLVRRQVGHGGQGCFAGGRIARVYDLRVQDLLARGVPLRGVGELRQEVGLVVARRALVERGRPARACLDPEILDEAGDQVRVLCDYGRIGNSLEGRLPPWRLRGPGPPDEGFPSVLVADAELDLPARAGRCRAEGPERGIKIRSRLEGFLLGLVAVLEQGGLLGFHDRLGDVALLVFAEPEVDELLHSEPDDRRDGEGRGGHGEHGLRRPESLLLVGHVGQRDGSDTKGPAHGAQRLARRRFRAHRLRGETGRRRR